MDSGPSIFGPVMYLFSFAIWIAILFWVYNNAEENYNAGCLWTLVVLVFGFLGLAIYLIVMFSSQQSRRHRAVDRNADFNVRAIYRDGSAPSPNRPSSGQWGHAAPGSRGLKPDPGFSDEDLDRLISSGRLSEAREYLRDMKSLAREMNDTTTLNNYSQYDQRIASASRQKSADGFSSRY